MNPSRRQTLGAMAIMALAGRVHAAHASESDAAAPGVPAVRLAAAWRDMREGLDAGHRVGVIEVDWSAKSARVAASVPVPSRAHGLMRLPDGGFVATAFRPGRWIASFDADGQPRQRVNDIAGYGERSTFNGHAAIDVSGPWLYTSETETQSGRIGVRDVQTLRKLDQWSSHGLEPHHLIVDPRFGLLVANGGIRRDAQDRKVALDRMASSLVQLDPATGAKLGAWHLPDPHLSLRHLAISKRAGHPLDVGVAMQAEHDDPPRRQAAPTLARWDGTALAVATHAAEAGGYAGDIAAMVGGAFALSAHAQDRAVRWQADRAASLDVIARLSQAGALASDSHGGVLIAAARGIGYWHPTEAPRLVPWPQAMAIDNHWTLLD